LHITNRKARYRSLFNSSNWETGETASQAHDLRERGEFVRQLTGAFEQDICQGLELEDCHRLADLKRIAMLLKMLEWPGFPAEVPASAGNRLATRAGKPNPRYMAIRLKDPAAPDPNEYKGLPVLPDPSHSRFGLLTGTIEPAKAHSLEKELPAQGELEAEAGSSEASTDPGLEATEAKTISVISAETEGASAILARTRAEELKRLLFGGEPEAVKAPTKPASRGLTKTAKEVVILASAVKKGRATVRTNDGQEIECAGIPKFPQREPGDECNALVKREDGKAISAVFTAHS